MKVSVICNAETLALGAIQYLNESGMLECVIGLERMKGILEPTLKHAGFEERNIEFLDRKSWHIMLSDILLNRPVDMVWVFGFPWLIPEHIYQLPTNGFFNFHFGTLPKYKGADPLFWQIRNGEKQIGVIVHKLTDELDGGPIVFEETIPTIPGETYAMLAFRLGFTTSGFLPQIIEAMKQNTFSLQLNNETNIQYLKRPTAEERSIRWKEQEADEIEALINACNPYYGGAPTIFRGNELKILEVSPADVNDGSHEVEPGTIVYADALYGLIVACKSRKYLRINTVSSREGYLSGTKLFALGVKPGERFNEPITELKNNEHLETSVPA